MLEAHVIVKAAQNFCIWSLVLDVIQTDGDGRLGIDGGQGPGQKGLFLVIDEVFLHLGGLHAVDVVINALQTAEFRQELEPRLFPDFCNARDVIRLVSHESLEVDKLSGGNAHFFHQRCWGKFLKLGHSFFGNFNDRIVIGQLNQVLVTADDGHIKRHFRPLSHLVQGADNVIGLVLVQFIVLDSHGIEHLADKGKLLPKLIRRLGPACLVVGKQLRPKSGFARIKSNQDMGRLNPLHHVVQHEVETIDGIGMKPSRTLEAVNLVIKGKKSPEGY